MTFLLTNNLTLPVTIFKNFAESLQLSEIFPIFAASKHINMVQNTGLNQAQMDFLRLLSHFTSEEEVRELNDLVCKYYAQKIDEEMDRLWDEGKWSHEKIEETLKEHLRTPYHVWEKKNCTWHELPDRLTVQA